MRLESRYIRFVDDLLLREAYKECQKQARPLLINLSYYKRRIIDSLIKQNIIEIYQEGRKKKIRYLKKYAELIGIKKP